MKRPRSNSEKADLIVKTVIYGIFFIALIAYGYFYFTSCAFTPIAETPVLCISR